MPDNQARLALHRGAALSFAAQQVVHRTQFKGLLATMTPTSDNKDGTGFPTKGGCDEKPAQGLLAQCRLARRAEFDRIYAVDTTDGTELRARHRPDDAGAQARRLDDASQQLPGLGL